MKKGDIAKSLIITTATGFSLGLFASDDSLVKTTTSFPFEARISLAVRLPKAMLVARQTTDGTVLVDQDLAKVLKLYGVTSDSKSKLEFHEEDDFIDLSCFNCAIRLLEVEGASQQPDNSGGWRNPGR